MGVIVSNAQRVSINLVAITNPKLVPAAKRGNTRRRKERPAAHTVLTASIKALQAVRRAQRARLASFRVRAAGIGVLAIRVQRERLLHLDPHLARRAPLGNIPGQNIRSATVAQTVNTRLRKGLRRVPPVPWEHMDPPVEDCRAWLVPAERLQAAPAQHHRPHAKHPE